MIVSIDYKTQYGNYRSKTYKVHSKLHFDRLLDKFDKVIDVHLDEKEFKSLKEK